MKSFCLTSIVAVVALLTSFPCLAVAQEEIRPGMNFASFDEAQAATGDGVFFAVFDPVAGEFSFLLAPPVQGFGLTGIEDLCLPSDNFGDPFPNSICIDDGRTLGGLAFGPTIFDIYDYIGGMRLPFAPDLSIRSAADFEAKYPDALFSTNTGFTSRVSVISAIPEPSTLGVVCLVSLGLAARRRR